MFNETYVFELVRRDENANSEETISMTINSGEELVTHMQLAKHFNDFLTSCGYAGHNYVNSPE